MRSRTSHDLSSICTRCFLKKPMCLCSEMPQVHSNIEIVIIRHVSEEHMTSNTGRLAALMLSNLRIVPYGGDEPFDEAALSGDDTWLLYPDPGSAEPSGRPRRLVLLDATFRQARRMHRRIAGLHQLPHCVLRVPERRSPGRRTSPRPDGLSTIEAIAAAIAQYEDPALAAPLMTAYAEFVRRADITRGRKRNVD